MTEEFLHYLWKYRLFAGNLHATDGRRIEVVHPGTHNTDAGPDFTNARVYIGGTLWAGNVEIHLRSSDWILHAHHLNPGYDNIILHVVHECDEIIRRSGGSIIPTLRLKGKFNERLFNNYTALKQSKLWIPCERGFNEVDPVLRNLWLVSLSLEKLQERSDRIGQLLKQGNFFWESVFFQQLARSFGFGLNGVPFELLAKSLPVHLISRHKDRPFQLEALFFGQAGMLGPEVPGEYPESLLREYEYLKRRYRLTPMDGHLWKFMRLRPSGFPTIRISQLANLLSKEDNLFTRIFEMQDLKNLSGLFQTTASAYWTCHCVFGKTSPQKVKTLGMPSIYLLILNTVIPFIFLYGEFTHRQELKEHAINLLELLPPENNAIVRRWGRLGPAPRNASESQALMLLKQAYCDKKMCLRCRLGNFLLRKSVL